MVWHFILLGVLIGFGIFFVMTMDKGLDVKIKGEWQYNFLNNYVIVGEKQLLEIDQIAQYLGEKSAVEFSHQQPVSAECGQENGVTYWNNGDMFCFPDLVASLNSSFHRLLKEEFGQTHFSAINYNITYEQGELIGKADHKLALNLQSGLREQALSNIDLGELSCLQQGRFPSFGLTGEFSSCEECPLTLSCLSYPNQFYCDLNPCHQNCVSFFIDDDYLNCGECPEERSCNRYLNQYFCELDSCDYNCSWNINRCEESASREKFWEDNITEKIVLVSFPGMSNYDTSYSLAPHFRIKLNLDGYQQLQLAARELLNDCRNSAELHTCLDVNKPANWHYTSCAPESFPGSTRKIPFCVSGNQEYRFGLDFTPSDVFPVEQFTIICAENNCQLTLPYNPQAQRYTVHFTNWEGVTDNSGTADQVFSAVLPELGYFYETAVFTNPLIEDCAAPVANHAYLCDNQLIYLLENSNLRATDDYFFTLTVTEDGEESFIIHFEQATITP